MRTTLGGYGDGLAGLTLHDLSELIRRAGLAAGFDVQSEFLTKIVGRRNRRRIDWVWLDETGSPIVAFEVEGHNVAPASLEGDHEKFASLPNTCIKVLALYSITNSHRLKALPPGESKPKRWVRNHWPERPMRGVKVLTDVELLAAGGIEQLQMAAIRAGAL